MVTHHSVNGFDECIKLLDGLEEKPKVVLFFSGTVNDKGENWCPDCQLGENFFTLLKTFINKNICYKRLLNFY